MWKILTGILSSIFVVLFILFLRSALKYKRQDGPNLSRVKPRVVGTIISFVFIIGLIICSWLLPPVTQCAYSAKIANVNPGGFKCAAGSISIDGSTALKPLITIAIKNYQNKCPTAKITIKRGNGSRQGLDDVRMQQVNIGTSDVLAGSYGDGYQNLEDHPIAAVMYTIIINPSVKMITSLSPDQIQKIYDGTFKKWSDLDIPDPENITAYTRDPASGSQKTFAHFLLGDQHSDDGLSAPTATADPSSGTGTKVQSSENNTTTDMIKAVEAQSGAIGYASYPDVEKENNSAPGKLNTVAIDNHPTGDFDSGSYIFWNIEHMYTKSGHTSELAKDFIDFVTTEANTPGKSGSDLGYEPLNKAEKLLEDHCPI